LDFDWLRPGEVMIVDSAVASAAPFTGHRPAEAGVPFAAVLAEYAATPLFAPWPIADQSLRANTAITGAALNTHPATSNRREGRHARG
jgi:hypothetical protein